MLKMKATFAIVITLFVSLSAIGANKNLIQKSGNDMTATFIGITDNSEFKFKNGDKEMLFQELGEEVDIDLSEDTYINKKFIITWEEASIDIYDDEGEPTGEKIKVNRILKLKVAK